MKSGTNKKITIALVLISTSLSQGIQANTAAKPSNDYTDLWLTDDNETIVKIIRCKQSLCGRIVGFIDKKQDYGKLSKPERNKAIKDLKAICATDLMGGFKKVSDEWKKGWIIDFEGEKKYSASVKLVKNRVLKVRIYKWVETFGESFLWTRQSKIQITCASIRQEQS